MMTQFINVYFSFTAQKQKIIFRLNIIGLIELVASAAGAGQVRSGHGSWQVRLGGAGCLNRRSVTCLIRPGKRDRAEGVTGRTKNVREGRFQVQKCSQIQNYGSQTAKRQHVDPKESNSAAEIFCSVCNVNIRLVSILTFALFYGFLWSNLYQVLQE